MDFEVAGRRKTDVAILAEDDLEISIVQSHTNNFEERLPSEEDRGKNLEENPLSSLPLPEGEATPIYTIGLEEAERIVTELEEEISVEGISIYEPGEEIEILRRLRETIAKANEARKNAQWKENATTSGEE